MQLVDKSDALSLVKLIPFPFITFINKFVKQLFGSKANN